MKSQILRCAYEPRSAAFRPQTPLLVQGARHLPKGVEVPARLRPEGRVPKFRFMQSPNAIFCAHWDHEPSAGSGSADAHIRQCIGHRVNRTDVGVRAPTGKFMESLHGLLTAHWDHELRCPRTRPSGTLSPTGGEGRGEGA